MGTELMALPSCPVHGQTILRPKERQSYEQQWCGTWYDCPQCGYSALYTSRELWEYLEGQAYRYRLTNTGHSSSRYGSCEVCGDHCSEVFHQVEERQYKPGRFTRHMCSDLWGHKECLVSIRREHMKTNEIGKLESGQKDPCFDCALSDSPNCSSCEDYSNYRQRWEPIKRIFCKNGEVPFQEFKGRQS